MGGAIDEQRAYDLSKDSHRLAKEVIKLRNQVGAMKSQQTILLTDNKNLRLQIRNELDLFYRDSKSIKDFITNANTRIANFIQQETRLVLSEGKLPEIIRSYVKDMLDKDKLMELTKEISQQIVGTLNRNLRAELKVTKAITYSIESEIKHLGFDLPLSFDETQKIKKRIDLAINDTVKKIEVKELQKLE